MRRVCPRPRCVKMDRAHSDKSKRRDRSQSGQGKDASTRHGTGSAVMTLTNLPCYRFGSHPHIKEGASKTARNRRDIPRATETEVSINAERRARVTTTTATAVGATTKTQADAERRARVTTTTATAVGATKKAQPDAERRTRVTTTTSTAVGAATLVVVIADLHAVVGGSAPSDHAPGNVDREKCRPETSGRESGAT